MTKNEQIQNIIRARFPRASQSFLKANTQLQPAGDKRDGEKKLAKMAQDRGAPKSEGRVRVCYTFCRVRPLDWDNCAGSTKQITDCLRLCGLIPGDDPTQIKLELEQEKVKTYADERTEIEIIYPFGI
jgi:hypothetical protein